MKKQLKDYLSFYVGCECKTTNQFGAYSFVKITHKLLEEDNPIAAKSTIEPILRPLTDMTKDESKELKKIRPSIVYGIPVAAEMTHYLLSKHFDLFGLIEAGLAIDKTTL